MPVPLAARNVSVRFGSAAAPAVSDVTVEIETGSATGIVGESGSGKTTVARVLVGSLEPTTGEVLVSGRRWAEVHRRDPVRRSVQMVFQDPYGALNPWQSARRTVAEVLLNWRVTDRPSAAARAAELLQEVGLSEEAIDRRPARLSGGQCQRVGIARALACSPAILVADEPTSSLDVSVQGQILNLLISLRESRRLALVMISHDLSVVRYMTDVALVMYRGHVLERGPTSLLLSQPSHPYTRALIDSIPGREQVSRLVDNGLQNDSGCVFANRCAYLCEDCLAQQPELGLIDGRLVACLHPQLVLEKRPLCSPSPESV
jgi:oligopeptide/dipeptide ABC transporter ATP-binding protein